MRLVIAILATLVAGCTTFQPKAQSLNDNPLVICSSGVQAYMHASKKIEAVGQEDHHIQVHCK